MSNCPKCQQPVETQAIECPYCKTILKAYGHPGIPLYQASQDEFLCDRCTYHEDDSCNYSKRPYAKTCTLYYDKTQPLVMEETITLTPSNPIKIIQRWCYRNRALLLIIGLIGISLLIALLN
ncbi:zinc ribbon domain-containing protein [Crocosphaera sp. UHCC 0190]|uniref:zinc ribbon domain-containing protein n=1 Tax=Crocosphaera sp. UHCC 0190 TaxID=3110246 RepID=UPI002B1F80D1|nr:zinc ribbon domain-containing protein [Crocosphaera sp. UHCC 0190]MEA5512356.1 zinc ribbon domain-containing protein [Crocosphaera sp. UHCC 0190]